MHRGPMSRTPFTEKDPIAVRHQVMVEASKRADLDALTELFCEDAVLMAPNETTLYGRAEVRNGMKNISRISGSRLWGSRNVM